MLASIKFRIVAIVVVAIVGLLGVFPFVGSQVENATISAFEDQARGEQRGLFERIVASHKEGLVAWMRPWLKPENLGAFEQDEFDRSAWESSLLGVGNQLAVKFGVSQILSFTFDDELLMNYRVDEASKFVAAPDHPGVQAAVEFVIDNEAIGYGNAYTSDGVPMFVVAIPAEDSEEELSSIHVFMGTYHSVLQEFFAITNYDALLQVGSYTSQQQLNRTYQPRPGQTVQEDQVGKIYDSRVIELGQELFGASAQLVVLVDKTVLYQRFEQTRSTVLAISAGVFVLFVPVFVFLVIYLLAPLGKIVKTSEQIAQGNYDQRVDIVSKSEIGKLAGSFNEMVAAIQVSDSNMRSLLAGLTEGVFFFDRNGQLAKERSQALGEVLPGSEAAHSLHDFFAKYTKIDDTTVATVLGCLWDDSGFINPFDGTVAMLPQQFEIMRDGQVRHVRLTYRELLDSSGELDKVIVFVADVTEVMAAEHKQKLQSERIKRISMAAANTEAFEEFYTDAIRFFKRIDQIIKPAGPVDPGNLKRDLHTLKGNTATFEFSTLASLIHELEDLIKHHDPVKIDDLARSKWELIKDQWKFETSDIQEVLGLHKTRNYTRVDRRKVDAIKTMIAAHGDQALKDSVMGLDRYPVNEVFGKYERMVHGLAQRTGKSVHMHFSPESDELSFSELQSVDGALVHIFRNVVDHGIESCEAREQLGKSRDGKLNVECYRKPNQLHLVIKDDGKGIDTEALAAKAVASGHWTQAQRESASFDDKLKLIFAASLSTAERVTETSGRGVGMDAVKNLIEELGGRISVYSEPGTGTQFEIDFPWQASAQSKAA